MATNAAFSRPAALPSPRWQLFYLFGFLVLLIFLLFGLLYLGLPHLRRALVAEDGFAENLTVFLYLEAALICAVVKLRRRVLNITLPRGYSLVGLLSLLFILEEISYGQRLFPNLRFPELANGATFDALSDLNRVMTIALDRTSVPWELVVLGALVLLAAAFGRRAYRALLRSLQTSSVWFYLLAAGLCLLGATFIDTYINPPIKFVLLEEVLELNAALSLLFAALAGFLTRREDLTRAPTDA